MLYVYGPMLPVRILEEIVFWKTQEKEHTEVIKAIVPNLEQPNVKLLDEWAVVFGATEEAARHLLESALSTPAHGDQWALINETEQLLRVASAQSTEFIRQLYAIMEGSAAVKAVPLATVVLLHIIRESEYFLAVLQTLNTPGQLGGLMREYALSGLADPEERSSEQDYAAENDYTAEQGEYALGDLADSEQQPREKDYTVENDYTVEQSEYVLGDLANSEQQSREQDYAAKIVYSAEQGGHGLSHLADSEERSVEPDYTAERGYFVEQDGPYWLQESRELSAVPIGGHRLPPLPYAYNALEPYIDEKTMRIHHDKHHQSYVDGLNTAETKLAEARKSGNFDLVKHWERELAFNGAGHYLHTIFWNVMSPQGGGHPTGPLLDAIEQSFGSYDSFKQQFSEAANKVEGGGWAILVWSPRSHRLEILTAEKHQNLSQWDVIPLLALDVWEHAYYLKHQNKRDDYIKDWWNVVNWPYVSERYNAASKLAWQPY
ncbi:superoxide dismutase [Bacillus sp. FJAT-27264]|uniref:Fe-Mn family superoxide dismutase n=1 Tax=Paenibacillus sp. (strain DSM 101736 / FJAT-27264) TaxID=1850362 RepID=UPI0008080602|nr:Fe-Mn family superoxide dismutase [Bacillus sp. FJAT-27264]OBZ10419.1 superoxide dismutase [Bacillus sp. FJAT-27264]